MAILIGIKLMFKEKHFVKYKNTLSNLRKNNKPLYLPDIMILNLYKLNIFQKYNEAKINKIFGET